jgi:DNA-binding LacI/PurR family transcriptional regulator
MGSSLKEIAERVGTSSASVSIYLNHPDTKRVSLAMKKKIDVAVKELNYRKNIFASSLSKNESKVIGVLIPSNIPLFQNGYTNTLLSGIQSNLALKEYSLLFFPSSASSSKENVQEQLQHSAGCDGYILFSTGFCTMEHILWNIRELENTGKPFVTLNIPEVPNEINQIIIKDLVTLRGLEYLLEAGHKKILLILGRSNGEHMQLILKEYRNILKQWSLPFDNGRIIYGNYSHRDTFLKVSSFLAVNRDITAICAMSDLMASSSLAAVKATGLTVPGDISIIGRNNSLYSELADPPLSTLALKIEDAGRSAADLLLQQISDPATCR